jgi:hypothetical protein
MAVKAFKVPKGGYMFSGPNMVGDPVMFSESERPTFALGPDGRMMHGYGMNLPTMAYGSGPGMGMAIKLGMGHIREKVAELSPEVHANLMAKIKKEDGKWNWTGSVNNDGYPKMKDEGELRLSSHLVLEQNGTKVPEGKVVMHKDNDPKNIAPGNLRVGTQVQNLKQMRDEGRDRPRGVAQEPDVKQASVFASFAEEIRKELQK